MAEEPATFTDKLARGAFTLLVQAVFLILAFFATLWIITRPPEDGEAPPNLLYSLLFVGGVYALAGAVARVLAHKRDDDGDYWGKQLGLSGATVALIGALTRVPSFSRADVFWPAIGAFALAGIVGPSLILASRAVSRWLRHQPPGCSDARAW